MSFLVHHFLKKSAEDVPNRSAIVASGLSFNFRKIDEASDSLASELQHLGIIRGDRVAVMLESSAEIVIALWAILKAGAVFIPINSGAKADKIGFILADSGAAILVAPVQLRGRVSEAMAIARFPGTVVWAGDNKEVVGPRLAEIMARSHETPKDPGLIDQDLCLIIYTSGSTGTPKGVMLTHRSICNNVWSISTYLRNTMDDVVLCVLPLSFDYGLFQVLTGARVGFNVVLQRSFAYPYDTLRRIAECRVTGLPGVPTIFARLLEFAPFEGLDLSSLRYMSNTGAALPAAHIASFRRLLPNVAIFSMFGLTECTRVSYLDPARIAVKPMSVGRAMPNSETYIVDEAGMRSGPGEVGELVVRGASLMVGYWRRPDETARALRDGDIFGEKVLYTGDLFWMDEDGDLYFVGRRDDVFKCRGEKVSPREVEACLYEVDAIAEAAVVGVPHPIDGMAIKAYIVLRGGGNVSEAMIRTHCRERLEPQLVPRFFEFRANLPKTDSGKISKKGLLEVTTRGIA
jgi:long-chain acyl-CoA synthetase